MIYRDGPSDGDDRRKRRAVTSLLPSEGDEREDDDLEWVVLEPSVSDSGTCSASASTSASGSSSIDDSLDIDIGDLCKHTHGI